MSPLLIWSLSALAASLTAGYGVLFTVVGDFRQAYGISELAIGWIIGVGFIAGFVAQLFIAPIGDRGHVRTLILAGVLVNAVGLVMMGLGDDTLTISAGRIVSGLAIGTANPAIRRIVVVSSSEHLGRNLGRLLSASIFGFAIGPAISAVLVGPFGLAAPFFVIAAASLVAVMATVSTPMAESGERSKQRLALDLLRDRSFSGAVVLGATAFLMIGTFDALWDVVHVDLGTPGWIANLGITLFSIPLVVLGPTAGKLAQEVGPFRVASIGLVVGAAFMASYGLAPSGMWIFGLSLGHAISDGLTFAAAGVAIAMTAPVDRQAGAHGVLGAAQALMAGVMAVVAGALYQWTSRPVAYLATAAAMIALIGLALALATDGWRRRARPEPTP